MSLFQTLILLLFNDAEKYTLEEIAELTKIGWCMAVTGTVAVIKIMCSDRWGLQLRIKTILDMYMRSPAIEAWARRDVKFVDCFQRTASCGGLCNHSPVARPGYSPNYPRFDDSPSPVVVVMLTFWFISSVCHILRFFISL